MFFCAVLTTVTADIDDWHYAGVYPLIGWVLHYLPFITMGRVTYVHHYYPALYFAILVFGFLFNHFAKKLPKIANVAVYLVAYAIIIGVFILFIPISFGMKGPAKQWAYLKWTVSVTFLEYSRTQLTFSRIGGELLKLIERLKNSSVL